MDDTYAYDAAGSRMMRTESGETVAYTLGTGDRLASWTGGAYTHDTAGNVTRIERIGRPTLDLVWNSQYQLASVSTNGVFAESYEYDALNRRVSTTTIEGTVRHVYDDSWQVIADLDEQGSVVVSYVWGEGIDNLLAVTVDGATYYVLTDVQGTVWGYVDSQNDVVARWQYDAWGNVIAEDVSVPALARIRYRFQGREWSVATGLTNFRMRWYDTETGRWLSKDPIGLSGGLNLYAFCGNDPVCKNDFLGLMHNVPIPGTDYEGRVEVQADKRNSRQGDSMLWHVDIQEPDTGKKVWSGVFDGSGEYVRGREGYGQSDISRSSLEAVKRWEGPKIRKQACGLTPRPQPSPSGGCPRGNGPTRGGMGIRPRGGGLLNKPGGGIRDPWMLVSPYLL